MNGKSIMIHSKLLLSTLIIMIIIIIFVVFIYFVQQDNRNVLANFGDSNRKLSIEWTENVPTVSSESLNVSCHIDGRPICCAILDHNLYTDSGGRERDRKSFHAKIKSNLLREKQNESIEHGIHCIDTRVYHPSP